jgi:hypothetical protein
MLPGAGQAENTRHIEDFSAFAAAIINFMEKH